MRFGNILVNNAQDLKIVAMLDWEWSYAAPYQMFYSPPRYLLMKKPRDFNDLDLIRYQSFLELFLDELKSQEVYKSNPETQVSLSDLMRQSMTDGKFWLTELIYSAYTGPKNRAWVEICALCPNLDKSVPILDPELDAFTNIKMKELEAYKTDWASIKAEKERKAAELKAMILKYTLDNPEIAAKARERGFLPPLEDATKGEQIATQ
jgi:hypothetical protein